MAGIAIDRVTKTFGNTPVLKGVSLTIADGEFVSLVGPSGCGKSTLLRIIAGLEPQTTGQIRIDGVEVDHLRPSARNLAMVFQSYALYPHLSVCDNMAVPLRMRRLSALQRFPGMRRVSATARATEHKIREDVERVALLLDIQGLLDRKPAQLSGGQRQRVAVGRAIVREPKGFLFDEPLSNLDAKLRVHMRAELAQLHRGLGVTFVYVTHDQAEAMTMSDRIAVMMDGELIQVGTPDEIYADPRDIRVAEFIGSPKINVLPGRITADGFACVDPSMRITGNRSADSAILIGVRPESMRVGAGSQTSLSGRVTYIENLGAEMYVHVALDGAVAPVVARVEHARTSRIRIDDELCCCFDDEEALVFDAKGKRIDRIRTRSMQPGAVRFDASRLSHG